MIEDNDEDFDFEYEDDDDEAEAPDVGLENKYYGAKGVFLVRTLAHSLIRGLGKKEDDPDGALKDFDAVAEAEQDKGDWCATRLPPTSRRPTISFPKGF